MTQAQPALLVVTDLDGTLLDHATYSYAAAEPALEALRASGIPLVLATSKTLAEVEPMGATLGTHTALIVENGGAVLVPAGHLTAFRDSREAGTRLVIELGVARDHLVHALDEIARVTGTTLRGFAQLTLEEIAALTNLPLDAAGRAAQRQYDEPFQFEPESRLPDLVAEAERHGLVVTSGGRFHHLTGQTDKGRALRRLLSALAPTAPGFTTVGLGDAANDLSFLQVVDRPVIVPRPDGRLDATLVNGLPTATHAPSPGPAGWNEAVLAILAGQQR